MKFAGAVISVLAIAGSLANAASVALLPGATLSHETNLDAQSYAVPALPYQTTASISGASGSNTGIYDLASSEFSMTLRQHGSSTDYFGRSLGQFEFTVSEAGSYAVTALYRTQGAAEWTGYIDLVDQTSGQTLYRSIRHGPGGVLPDALPAGADSSSTGAAIGALQPGQTYLLRYVLYSMVGGGGGTMFGGPDGPVGGPDDPIRGSLPRPPYAFMGVDGSIGVTFGAQIAAVPLPPAAWGGLALLATALLPKVYRRLRRTEL